VFIVFFVGFFGSFYVMWQVVWPQLKADLLAKGAVIVAVTPFDVILLQAKIGLIVGVLVSIPPLLYFSRDALRERNLYPEVSFSLWQLAALGLVAAVLFVAGIAYAYAIIFPFLFDFLVKNAIQAGFEPTYSIIEWTQFIAILSLVMGLTAELPFVMTALAYTGAVLHETFWDRWRYAVMGIVVFAALADGSPDPVSMSLVAVPMLVLYGIGLGCAKIAGGVRGRGERPATGERTEGGSGLDAGLRAAPEPPTGNRGWVRNTLLPGPPTGKR
jgi:sec-independent protein translocase protein TatC